MSKDSVSADRLDKPVEYATAGIPHYWRIERQNAGLIAYTHILNATTRSYAGSGAHTGVLKTEQPFPVAIDLDALT
ncbi:MAG: hypothetical protein ACJ72W_05610 [Actinoallomurus sp.]